MKKQNEFYDNKKLTLQRLKVIDYLQKSQFNMKAQNIDKGAVLSFNLRIKRNTKSDIEISPHGMFDLLSILLFLDFKTGRIERYLINSSNPKLNKKGIDFKEDLFFYWNNEKYRMFYEEQHLPISDHFSLSNINDGKLSRKFFISFMTELVRDYLHTNNSFLDGNIASLKKITKPLIPTEYKEIMDPKEIDEARSNNNLYVFEDYYDRYFTAIKAPLGTGKIETFNEKKIINESKEYKLKDIIPFWAHRFIDNEEINEQKTIYIPKQFKNDYLIDLLDNQKFKINLVYAKRTELPQIVKDFVRSLDIKTITKPQDITTRIKFFNNKVVERLNNQFYGPRPKITKFNQIQKRILDI